MVMRRNLYKGVYLQKGAGIGAVLSSLFRVLVPFLKKGAKAAIKSAPVKRAFKSAKKAALVGATDIAKDVIGGRNPKTKAKLNLKAAQRGIERALEDPFEDVPRVKKKRRQNRVAKSRVIVTKPGLAPLL